MIPRSTRWDKKCCACSLDYAGPSELPEGYRTVLSALVASLQVYPSLASNTSRCAIDGVFVSVTLQSAAIPG